MANTALNTASSAVVLDRCYMLHVVCHSSVAHNYRLLFVWPLRFVIPSHCIKIYCTYSVIYVEQGIHCCSNAVYILKTQEILHCWWQNKDFGYLFSC